MDELVERLEPVTQAVVGTVTVVVGIVVVGRGLNSEFAQRHWSTPIIGPFLEAGAKLINQVYDHAGAD